jgi:ADP-heptose:LPS heptosyltransferase
MKGTWIRGSLLERLVTRLRGPHQDPDKPLDIFAELRRAHKVLLMPNDRVGGLFLGATVYQSIRQYYPDAHISLLTDERWAPLARQIPFVDDVIVMTATQQVWSQEFRAFVEQLRADAYDLVVCLGPDCSYRLARLCGLSGARLRVGFQREGLDPYNVEIVRRSAGEYESDQYQSLLRILGLDVCGEVQWAIGGGKSSQMRDRYLDREFASGSVIGIDLVGGEGQGMSGRQLDDIVGRVIERGARAVLFFSLAGRKQVNYLKKTYGNRVLPFEQNDLSGVAALLEGCRALISCNTDVLHLAISLRLPCVAIFDEDARRWISSRNELVEVVQDRDIRAVSITQVVEGLDRALSRLPAEVGADD